MSFRIIGSASAAALSIALVAVASLATAQPSIAKIELAQAAMQGEADLAAYAAATAKVLQIQQSMNEQMNAAGQGELSQIQTEAQAAMVAAIEGEGLTVQEFNAIGERARDDPQLAETLNRLIREKLGG